MVTTLSLSLAVKCYHLVPVTPITFRVPNFNAAVLTVRSGLHRQAIADLFKDAEALFINMFLSVAVEGVSGPSPGR